MSPNTADCNIHSKLPEDPACYPYDLDYIYPVINATGSTIPVRESQRPSGSSQDNSTSRPPCSRSGTITAQSPDGIGFSLGQPPAQPPTSPLRVRSPGVPPHPSPAVSETPMPRVSSPSSAYTHMRTTSVRLSQAVKSVMPGRQRRNSSATPGSPPAEDHKDRAKAPTGFLSVDRWPTVVPPLSHANTSEFLTRVPRSSQTTESLVLQKARAYEQLTGEPFEIRRLWHGISDCVISG